jgi:hypothetical protein
LKLQQYSIAGRWLDLAELALHSRPKLIAKARADIELGTLLRTQYYLDRLHFSFEPGKLTIISPLSLIPSFCTGAEIIKQFHHLMKTRVRKLHYRSSYG